MLYNVVYVYIFLNNKKIITTDYAPFNILLSCSNNNAKPFTEKKIFSQTGRNVISYTFYK